MKHCGTLRRTTRVEVGENDQRHWHPKPTDSKALHSHCPGNLGQWHVPHEARHLEPGIGVQAKADEEQQARVPRTGEHDHQHTRDRRPGAARRNQHTDGEFRQIPELLKHSRNEHHRRHEQHAKDGRYAYPQGEIALEQKARVEKGAILGQAMNQENPAEQDRQGALDDNLRRAEPFGAPAAIEHELYAGDGDRETEEPRPIELCPVFARRVGFDRGQRTGECDERYWNQDEENPAPRECFANVAAEHGRDRGRDADAHRINRERPTALRTCEFIDDDRL